MCNFGRGFNEEHLNIEFRPVVKEEMTFKDISYFNSGGNFVLWSRRVCANLVVDITINISVKLLFNLNQ